MLRCAGSSLSLEVAICLAKDAVEQRCNSSHASGTKWYTLLWACEQERMPLLRHSPLGTANSEGWQECQAACKVFWKMTVYLLLPRRQEALSSPEVFKLFIYLLHILLTYLFVCLFIYFHIKTHKCQATSIVLMISGWYRRTAHTLHPIVDFVYVIITIYHHNCKLKRRRRVIYLHNNLKSNIRSFFFLFFL